ncbi:MAG TPA: peptidoglycan-binding protein [Blastocatellia bacterium]|nr:peptidoglycan-binding protein [Blastocatellia bacterium]
MSFWKKGDSGPEIIKLQKKLLAAGFNPGPITGKFDLATEIALKAFQKSHDLLDDGKAGAKTLAILNKFGSEEPVDLPLTTGKPVIERFTPNLVRQIFSPQTPLKNINAHLPVVLQAMQEAGMAEKNMILMALATIRVETEGFAPINELRSKFNTSPTGHPFDLYDNRKDLGNQGPPDGERFKGRGFIQLTGRVNYQEHGAAIGMGNQLIENPELANDPLIAARLLASFLKAKERRIKEALLDRDFKLARRLVNGGSHGLDKFKDTFLKGERLIG